MILALKAKSKYIQSKQQLIDYCSLLQSSNASQNEIEKLQDELKDLKQAHEDHKDEAEKSHSYYIKVTKQCAAEWEEIVLLEKKERLTRAKKLKLSRLKKNFTLVIHADYQMCKLVPYWGLSVQPGCT